MLLAWRRSSQSLQKATAQAQWRENSVIPWPRHSGAFIGDIRKSWLLALDWIVMPMVVGIGAKSLGYSVVIDRIQLQCVWINVTSVLNRGTGSTQCREAVVEIFSSGP
ncbi:hypothetical protein R1flu_026120 [Riccia fluitans]|uniref:Uncharacterized protein n=1 Tax=Riccia fluitans TaxID=41844 RepID=A0ABD1XF30_9MARC